MTRYLKTGLRKRWPFDSPCGIMVAVIYFNFALAILIIRGYNLVKNHPSAVLTRHSQPGGAGLRSNTGNDPH